MSNPLSICKLMLRHSSVRRKIRVLPINNVLKWSFSILWKLPKVTGLNGYDQASIRFLDTCHGGGCEGLLAGVLVVTNGVGLHTSVCGSITHRQGYLFFLSVYVARNHVSLPWVVQVWIVLD